MQVSWLPTARWSRAAGHGAVHTAGESQQHAAAADLTAALGHGVLQIGGHGPLGTEAADAVQEVLQDLLAVLGVQHLGVELYTVQVLFSAADGGMQAAVGMGDGREAGGQLLHLYAVTHPAHGCLRYALEQRGGVMGQLDLAVLPSLRLPALTTQQVHHQLLARSRCPARGRPV